MSEAFTAVYVVAAVILLFGAAVFVHELGHFLVARWRGLKVLEFSIGFGPKIVGWKRDGIEYSWRWIPAGGYVKLPQMVTSEALEGGSDEPVPPAPPLAKILVAVAGPLMNVVFAFLIAGIIYFVGLPVAINPPIIGHVAKSSPEYRKGIREGDKIVRVNGRPVRSWQDVQMDAALARTNVLQVVTERAGTRLTNYLATSVNNVLGLKMLDLEPRDHPVIESVQPGSPAEKAGLRPRDKFISFAGVPIVGQQQLVDLIQKRGGKPSPVEIQRGAEKLSLTVTPRITKDHTGLIGVLLTTDTTVVYRVERPGPKPWELVAREWDRTVQTIGALVHHNQTGIGPKDLSGPVGILAMLAMWVKTDYRLALNFLVLLNVNLAILNLLPIPVLDGGHILLACIEKIRRRPISPRIVEYTTTAFALLLVSFMLYVTYFDVTEHVPFFKSMFKQNVQIEPSGGSRSAPPPSR